MTFLELSRKILQENQVPLNGNEIWDFAVSKEYDKELRSVGKTPWQTILAQVYVSIRDKQNSPFALIPHSSELILNAKAKDNLDWEAVNKLAEENPDFRKFIKTVKIDLSSKKVHKEEYDRIIESEKLKISS